MAQRTQQALAVVRAAFGVRRTVPAVAAEAPAGPAAGPAVAEVVPKAVGSGAAANHRSGEQSVAAEAADRQAAARQSVAVDMLRSAEEQSAAAEVPKAAVQVPVEEQSAAEPVAVPIQ